MVGREEAVAAVAFSTAEKAYLATRKELAVKKQRKTLLIGHLDYIILSNEQSKAEKLAEIERTLGLTGKEPEALPASPAQPPPHVPSVFRGFNEEVEALERAQAATMQSVTTPTTNAHTTTNNKTLTPLPARVAPTPIIATRQARH